MNKLIEGLEEETSKTTTQNGAVTYDSTGNECLNFFAQAGAMRNRPEEALGLFQKAYMENLLIAVRILFYLRDIRGGQGERQLFRNCMNWLAQSKPDIFEKIAVHVPEYGRWDDLPENNSVSTKLIFQQLLRDLKAEHPSLLAKWLPTINASSKKTQEKAYILVKALGLKPIEYRRVVRDLRARIRCVEELMSANKWNEVEYSQVPSQAGKKYRKAFEKRDGIRYGEFLGKVKSGEVKINTSTLYPYQIYDDVMKDGHSEALEVLWSNLPDYTRGNNALVVADVSGSMDGRPMSVSVSLALYFAERNKGQFQNHFIIFSAQPRLQKILGNTLYEKMYNLQRAEWDMNTNLEAVFELILKTAVDHEVPENEMPSTIYIISDMEFDQCITNSNSTLYQDIKNKYRKADYTIPTVMFWNVNASGNNLPVRQNQSNTTLVSGFSPSVFKLVVENKTPAQLMLDVVNSERYLPIEI